MWSASTSSHPHSPAIPSATDRAEAAYPDHVHVIVSLMGRTADVNLYQLVDGDFCETPLVVE